MEELNKPEWQYTTTNVCLVLDTLGQERMQSHKEKKYAFSIMKEVKEKFEAFQEKQIEVLMTVIDELDDKSFMKD